MNWEGFLMGISDFGLERLKEERQLRMQKELERMRQDHKKELETYRSKLRRKEKEGVVSDTRGISDTMQQDVDAFGNPVGDPYARDPFVLEDRQMAREKHAREAAASARRLSQEDERLRIMRERNEAVGGAAGISTGQAANELINDFSDLVESYTTAQAGGDPIFSMEEVQQMAHAALRSATREGKDVADTFRRTLGLGAQRREAGMEGWNRK